MKKPLLFLVLLLFILFNSYAAGAATVKGIVTDKITGEPLIGATITLKDQKHTARSTAAGLDGSFIFHNVPAGSYELEFKYVSYQKTETKFELKEDESRSFKIRMESSSANLNEVAISSTVDKTTDASALRVEQRADQILNAVSARTIEASPDISIANVTQRVSGVSIQRSNNGEAQYAIIRGMDQRYEYTLVNGIKIPSPDNKNRYVPLDIFPADIVDRLEISKSLTPNMEGDAIAGAVNMVLKSAPDDFTLNVNLGTGYANSFFGGNGFTKFDHSASLTTSPRVSGNNNATIADFPNNPFYYSQNKTPLGTIFGLTVGGRSADKKFGAIATFSYQNSFRQTNGEFFSATTNSLTGAPILGDQESRVYDIQQQRSAVITKFDYRLNKANTISLDADYINLTRNLYRFVSDTSLSGGHTRPGVGNVEQDYRSDCTVQQIYNFDLHGEHKLAEQWKLDWTAVYSKATANEPDRADLNINVNAGSGAQPTLPTQTPVESRIFEKNSDENKNGYLNLTYSPKIANTKVDFTVGGMYQDKTRHSDYDDYAIVESGVTNQKFDGNIDHNTLKVQTTEGTPNDALDYNFTEKLAEAYGMLKFTAGKLLVLGGVRYEHTDQSWVNQANPTTLAGVTGSINYYDVLPSLALKYSFDQKQDLRFSYYSAISRPNFYELIPHQSGDPDVDYAEIGNPTLKRITADNLDLRYEFFPKGLDQLLVGVFYKNIKNPIEYAITPAASLSSAAANTYVLMPENFGNATNYGFELDATKYVRNFGIRLNYTFTNSEITTTKQQLSNAKVTLVNQTRPLQDQSKNIGNLSFLYRDSKNGFDAQISAVYTGPRIYAVSPYLNNDIWEKGAVTLDVSAEKKIFKKFYIYAKATNLTNTPFQLEIHQPYVSVGNVFSDQTEGKNIFIRKDTYEQYYILGLRYKL